MALYLKYRPQTLDQLIGQEAVKSFLLGAQKGDKFSHAYLFVGPRGTGKTSTARILAKMVNCEKGGVTPCNSCPTCLSITDSSCLDLIEIDAASNRGIDDVRALRENIKLSPSSAKKKVYIIDEVHMLTTEAFNALLKTLEEPPSHCLFILATTEVGKVPQTILSRVQRLDFKMAKTQDLIEALKVVIEAEKIKISDEALMILAKNADGSFRDGVKLLDQLWVSGEEITEARTKEILHTSDFEGIVKILENLSSKNSGEALRLLTKQLESGVSVKVLLFSFMDTLRALVFIKNELGALVKEDFGTDKFKILSMLGEKFSIKDLTASLDILQEASGKLKTASIASLPLELAMVEICGPVDKLPDPVIARSDVTSDRGNLKTEEEIASPSASWRTPSNDASAESHIQSQVPASIVQLASRSEPPTSNSDITKLHEKWTFILETVRPYNYSLEALLRSVKIADCTNGTVLLEVPYSFHQRILEAPKSKDLVESVLSEVLGRQIRVSTVLGARPQVPEDIANVELAADDEIISLASDIFNGKLVD